MEKDCLNIHFDYRKDENVKGRDPDKYSARLKKDHCYLWSKELPNKKYGRLNLEIRSGRIIGHANNIDFDFGCDSITHCFTYWESTKEIRTNDEIQPLLDEFIKKDYVIATSIIFPVKNDDGSSGWTINKARGCSRLISDRIDLTLECIRIFYENKNQFTPLQSCLIKYTKFFDLFLDFEHYVKYFYLDDLVSKDYKRILGFTDALDFEHSLPISTVNQYKDYIRRTIDFIEKRTLRIEKALRTDY